MDTTEKYIKMCEMAGEIQKAWKPQGGDFHYDKDYPKEVMIWQTLMPLNMLIWLPRQDQLQEIVCDCRDANGKYGKGAYLLRLFVKWMPTSKGNESGSSLEQLWLAFVMHEKYQKQWSDEKEIWKETISDKLD